MFTLDNIRRGATRYKSGAAITAGLAVIYSAASTVTKPTDGTVPFGVCVTAATAADESVEVQPFISGEEVRLISAGTITVGDLVEIVLSGSDAGKVQKLASGVARFVAVESAVAGDYALLRPVAVHRPGQAAPGTLNATGTLTLALIQTGIVTSSTASAVTGTTDTGALLDAGGLGIGEFYDFTVINTGGSNAFTLAGGSGVTLVGLATVAANTSGSFRLKRTADDTWIAYRR